MAYEYESKLLDYASDSKTYEEYKAMTLLIMWITM